MPTLFSTRSTFLHAFVIHAHRESSRAFALASTTQTCLTGGQSGRAPVGTNWKRIRVGACVWHLCVLASKVNCFFVIVARHGCCCQVFRKSVSISLKNCSFVDAAAADKAKSGDKQLVVEDVEDEKEKEAGSAGEWKEGWRFKHVSSVANVQEDENEFEEEDCSALNVPERLQTDLPISNFLHLFPLADVFGSNELPKLEKVDFKVDLRIRAVSALV